MLTSGSRKPTSHVLASASAPALQATVVVVVMVRRRRTTTTTVVPLRVVTAPVAMSIVVAPHHRAATTMIHAKTATAHRAVVARRWTTTPHHHVAALTTIAMALHRRLVVARTRTSRTSTGTGGSRMDVHQSVRGGMAEAMSVAATSQDLTGDSRPFLHNFLMFGDLSGLPLGHKD